MSSRGPASVMDTAPTDLGLVVQVGNGYERMVMADQEICDDVLATIPKLKAASAKDTFGRRWKQRKRKNGVDMFELSPGGGDDPDDDLDIAHALVAKTEIRCHLNEVLNVLVNPESSDYEASMQALCGRKFKRGHVLFKQRRKFHFRTAGDKEDGATVAQDGLVGVQLATLRPKLRVKMSTKHKRTQRLVFASCTQQYPSKDRAIHVVKTIPKDAHDQVVSSQDRAALRRELDHLAVGYDIQSKHNGYGSINHTTRIFLHAYASTVPPQQYGRVSRKHGIVSAADLARRREAIMNPEATQVLDILAKSLRQFETVIRRRRFGFQTFIYFPTHYNDASAHASCSICSKSFSLFRRDFFCQLCGNMVCNDCSQNYEVEPRIGEVRKNRCCIQCVVRVDSCVFDDEEMLPALGPVVVEADESAWWEEHPVLEDTGEEDDDDETVSVRSDTSGISDQLFSQDAAARSHALEMLAQLVRSSGSTQPPKTIRTTSGGRTSAKNAKPPVTTKQILRDVESHLSQSLRVNRDQYAEPDNCAVYEGERDYVYKYDPTATLVTSVDTPLGPVFQPDVEAKRLAYIEQSKVTEPQYDTAALDLLAQVAAQKLNCPIGFVSVIDHDSFRAVGRYNYPDDGVVLPRDESLCIHNVYAEKPMIIKNPQRDMRFAQMGCIKHMGVKFYAGFPIRAPDGSVVASLCTGDLVTHDNITTKDYATMQALTKLAADLLLPQMPKQPSQVRGVARDVSMHHQQQQQQQYGSGRGSQRGGHRADPYAVY